MVKALFPNPGVVGRCGELEDVRASGKKSAVQQVCACRGDKGPSLSSHFLLHFGQVVRGYFFLQHVSLFHGTGSPTSAKEPRLNKLLNIGAK